MTTIIPVTITFGSMTHRGEATDRVGWRHLKIFDRGTLYDDDKYPLEDREWARLVGGKAVQMQLGIPLESIGSVEDPFPELGLTEEQRGFASFTIALVTVVPSGLREVDSGRDEL